MVLFLRCGQRCFLAQSPSPDLLPPGLRTHRSVGATREGRGNGAKDYAKNVLLAKVLLAGMRGNGSALPGARPAQLGCPGKDSTSGTQSLPVSDFRCSQLNLTSSRSLS
jgi:hypothetical protein